MTHPNNCLNCWSHTKEKNRITHVLTLSHKSWKYFKIFFYNAVCFSSTGLGHIHMEFSLFVWYIFNKVFQEKNTHTHTQTNSSSNLASTGFIILEKVTHLFKGDIRTYLIGQCDHLINYLINYMSQNLWVIYIIKSFNYLWCENIGRNIDTP